MASTLQPTFHAVRITCQELVSSSVPEERYSSKYLIGSLLEVLMVVTAHIQAQLSHNLNMAREEVIAITNETNILLTSLFKTVCTLIQIL